MAQISQFQFVQTEGLGNDKKPNDYSESTKDMELFHRLYRPEGLDLKWE